MSIYRKKGTIVPIKGSETLTVRNWKGYSTPSDYNQSLLRKELISYGHIRYRGKDWIQCEEECYGDGLYYLILEEDLIPTGKIVGYKSPHDLFKGRVPKGSIFSDYSRDKFVMYCPKHKTSGVPTEIVETWEPVYEEEFKVGDYLIAERAGGWSYSPENDGCLIEVTRLGTSCFNGKDVQSISGTVQNPRIGRHTSFRDIPVTDNEGKNVFRKATPQEIEEGLRKTISVGGKFDVTIKNGCVYHKSDDITYFVKDLVSFGEGTRSFGNFKAGIEDITFSFTGCEKQQTKLSDWRVVYEAIRD